MTFVSFGRTMRRSARVRGGVLGALAFALLLGAALPALAGDAGMKQWKRGIGWGWVWGSDDEVGALNEMTPQSALAAVGLIREGRVYDMGLLYDRTSYKWPGHSPGEIIAFRTPEGVKRQGDLSFIAPENNPGGMAWHSDALFINDNVATQIDGLAHITVGDDNHWYNGFKEEDWGGNWGPRKCAAETIPPIVARGVMIDVAGHKGVEALDSGYEITASDLEAALAAQGTELHPGDVVLTRTGTTRYWGETGADHVTLPKHDQAGLGMTATRWLVEEHGAMMIGSDTSGMEVQPAPEGSSVFVPVHEYLLVEQGVHIAEFHDLEELARDKVYEFCYMATTNKIKGTTAGFTMRPIAIR